MTKRGRTLGVLLLCCSIIGCIELRDDIFHGQPPWESQRFSGVIKLNPAQGALTAWCQIPGDQYPKVGLSKLAEQVLDEDVRVVPNTIYTMSLDPQPPPNAPPKDLERLPLPENLKKDEVVVAMVKSLIRDYETLGVVVKCKGGKAQQIEKLPNTWLWRSEFKDFGKKVIDLFWKEMYGNNNLFPLAGKVDDEKVELLELLKAYLMEYYGGEYVDRYGTKYSKPQIDFSITNEVIVAIVNIFLEALADYSLIDLAGQLKDPIVFEWKDAVGMMAYINKTQTEPTFARFLRKTVLKTQAEPKTFPGLLEKVVQTGTDEGLTKQEVCVIHYLAGLSGEASEGLTGVIVRTLGGSNIGAPVALGKFSIGDNQTVAKLIDAAVETQTKRLADALFSHILYAVRYMPDMSLQNQQQGQGIDWTWLAKHIKLSEILTCFSRKSEPKDPS